MRGGDLSVTYDSSRMVESRTFTEPTEAAVTARGSGHSFGLCGSSSIDYETSFRQKPRVSPTYKVHTAMLLFSLNLISVILLIKFISGIVLFLFV